jgi:hypothetical protein
LQLLLLPRLLPLLPQPPRQQWMLQTSSLSKGRNGARQQQ